MVLLKKTLRYKFNRMLPVKIARVKTFWNSEENIQIEARKVATIFIIHLSTRRIFPPKMSSNKSNENVEHKKNRL